MAQGATMMDVATTAADSLAVVLCHLRNGRIMMSNSMLRLGVVMTLDQARFGFGGRAICSLVSKSVPV